VKIPDKLKVAGHYYKVIWDDKKMSKRGYLGETHHDQNIIYMCKEYRKRRRSKSSIEETFFHEMVHAIDANYNNHSLSEKVVDRLAVGIHQVLKDNFKF